MKTGFNFKNKNTLLLLFCFSLIMIHFSGSGWFSKKHETSKQATTSSKPQKDSLISLSSIDEKVKRSTKLGDSKTIKEKPKKETSVLINDPNMAEKWGLKLTDSSSAWKITQGSKKIIVAVIDTGIDIKHEDLTSNLWKHPGETGKDKNGKDKATNGIDDDGNGYVDDVYGWNFVANNNSLTDNHGHGTHISGILGAVGGNNKGISGVSPKVSIMSLKYFDPKEIGTNNLENTVKAIHYAIENGAKIINYSGGGTEFSKKEKEAIKRAQRKGILFVAAAGNEKSNSDEKKYYPADYDLDNIISVTAIDPNQNILPSSNYGKVTVDIAAPGKNIYSTLPNGKYGRMTGTSQATAFVTGVASLIMAHNEDYDAPKVAKYITNTGDVVAGLKDKTRYKRKLNSYRALSILDQGVAATGVVAENVQNLPKDSFSSQSFKYKTDLTGQEQDIKKFSASLLEKIESKSKEERSLNSETRLPNNKSENDKKQEKSSDQYFQ